MRTAGVPVQNNIRSAVSLWQSIVAQVPTVFGKLLWTSSFRVPGSYGYRHPGLEQTFSRDVTSRVLQESHHSYFEFWLAMGLQSQYDDFIEYVEGLRFVGNPRDFLKGVGDQLLPPSTIQPQQLLFETDLAVVLELLN